MIRRNINFLVLALILSSCLDREETKYQLNFEEYTLSGVYLKNCQGTPMNDVAIRLYAVSAFHDNKLLAQTSTNLNGEFFTKYILETTSFKFNSNDLRLYSYDESSGKETLISNRLPWQNELHVELIKQLKDTISIFTTGVNQLTRSDTLFIKEVSYSNSNYSKEFVGPFTDGQSLDIIVRDFQSFYPFEIEWYIADSCFYGKRNVNCHPGNFGFISEVIPYCNRLNVFIDLNRSLIQ